MTIALTAESILFPSPHLRVEPVADSMVFETLDACFKISGKGSEPAKKLFALLDGRKDIAAISKCTGMSLESVLRFFAPFYREQALYDLAPIVSAPDCDHFLDLYFQACDFWAGDIFNIPFWSKMLNGQASRWQVLGWGLQFYHRTVGADHHNATAVKYCSDAKIKEQLIVHYKEELGHGEIFLRGLGRCGFCPQRVATSQPIATTRALIDYMDNLGRTNSMAYLGCYGVLHSPRTGQTVGRLNSQFDRFCTLYPHAKPLLDKIRQHALIDLELGHEKIALEQLVPQYWPLPAKSRLDIIQAAIGMVDVFRKFFEGIERHFDCVERIEPYQPGKAPLTYSATK